MAAQTPALSGPGSRTGNTDRGSGMALAAGGAWGCSLLLGPQAVSRAQGKGPGKLTWAPRYAGQPPQSWVFQSLSKIPSAFDKTKK